MNLKNPIEQLCVNFFSTTIKDAKPNFPKEIFSVQLGIFMSSILLKQTTSFLHVTGRSLLSTALFLTERASLHETFLSFLCN